MMLVVKLNRTRVKPRSHECITASFGSFASRSERSERSLHRSLTPVSSSLGASGSRYPIQPAGHGPLATGHGPFKKCHTAGQTHSWWLSTWHHETWQKPREMLVLGYLGFRSKIHPFLLADPQCIHLDWLNQYNRHLSRLQPSFSL